MKHIYQNETLVKKKTTLKCFKMKQIYVGLNNYIQSYFVFIKKQWLYISEIKGFADLYMYIVMAGINIAYNKYK